MASNVFGDPITDATLREMPQYRDRTITRKDRADVAYTMRNANERDTHARQYVENLRQEWGGMICTLCVVYNATGDAVTFTTHHDKYGERGRAPYPVTIENGQWGGFLHVKTPGTTTGSVAAVVYRGKNAAAADCDWMLSWFNPEIKDTSHNKVYTEIREAHHYDEGNKRWVNIFNKVDGSGLSHNANWNGCGSMTQIGSGTSPIFEGTMKLESDA